MLAQVTEIDLQIELRDLRAYLTPDPEKRAYMMVLVNNPPAWFDAEDREAAAMWSRLDQLETVAALLRIYLRNDAEYWAWSRRMSAIAGAANETFGAWDWWPELYRRLFKHAARRFYDFMVIRFSVDAALLDWGYC